MPEVEPNGLAADLIQIEDQWGAHNYRPLDVVVERAAGVWVYAVDGRRYLDCLSAYSALNQATVTAHWCRRCSTRRRA